MPQSDVVRRLVDAGMALTSLSRAKAEAVVRELVRSGEVQREHAHQRVEELLERSRSTTEHLVGVVRKEVAAQLSAMGLATTDDLSELKARLARLEAAGTARPAPAKAAGTAGTGRRSGPTPPAGGATPS